MSTMPLPDEANGPDRDKKGGDKKHLPALRKGLRAHESASSKCLEGDTGKTIVSVSCRRRKRYGGVFQSRETKKRGGKI